MIAGQIEIQMLADTARIKKDMDDAKSIVTSAASAMANAMELVNGVLAGIAAGVSVSAFVGVVKGAIDAAEALHDLSIQTGATVESLSAMQAIGRMTGTSAETIGAAMNKLAKNMAVANEESKGTAQALKALGIDFASFKALKPEDQMVTLAKAMNQFEDGSGKSAAAMTLMGKEGAKLLPFMKDLATAGELVATVTTEQAEMADRYNDALEAGKLRTEALQRTLAFALLPTLIDVHDMTRDFARIIGEYLATGTGEATQKLDAMKFVILAVGKVLETLIVVGSDVAFVFKAMGRDIGASAAAFIEMQKMNFAGARTILNEVKADDAEARRVLDDFQSKITGVTEKALQARDALAASTVTTADNARELNRFNEVAGKATQGQVKFSAAVKDSTKVLKDQYASMIAASSAHIAQLAAQANAETKLTEGEKRLLDMQSKIEAGTLTYTAASYKSAAAKFQEEAAAERLATATLAAAKATEEAMKAYVKEGEALDKATESLLDSAEKQNIANLSMRTGIDYTHEYEVAKIRQAAVTQDVMASLEEEGDATSKLAVKYRENAAALRQFADSKEAAIGAKAAKEAGDAWAKAGDTIADGLTNALTHGFRSVWDYIKNLAKTEAIQFILRPTVGGVLGGVGSLLGAGAAMAGDGTGVGGAANGLSSIGSLLGAGGAVSQFGSYFASGFMNTIAGTGTAAGLEAGGAMVAGGAATEGVGMSLGSLGPWGIVAALVIAALSDHSKWSMGSVAGGSFGADGQFGLNNKDLPFAFGNNTEHQRGPLEGLLGSIGNLLSGTAAGFGGSVGSGVGISAATDTDREGQAAGILALLLNGVRIGGVQTGTGSFSGNDPGAATKIAADQMSAWFQSAVPQLIVQGLQQSDLPTRFHDFFNSVAAADLTAEKATQMLQTAQAIKNLTDSVAPLGGVFARLSDVSIAAVQNLAQMTGGIDAFMQKTADYVSNYYTQEEQLRISAQNVLKTVAAAGIDASAASSRDQLRTLMDSLDITTASGQAQMAALLNVEAEYAKLADYLTANNTTLGKLAEGAPQVAAINALADPAAATAEATTSTAETVKDVASSTADTATAVKGVAEGQETQTAVLVDGLTKTVALLTTAVDQMTQLNGRLSIIVARG